MAGEFLPASVIFPILANEVLPESQVKLLSDSFNHQSRDGLLSAGSSFWCWRLLFTIGCVFTDENFLWGDKFGLQVPWLSNLVIAASRSVDWEPVSQRRVFAARLLILP